MQKSRAVSTAFSGTTASGSLRRQDFRTSNTLDDRRDALAEADAHRGQTDLRILLLHHVQQRGGDTRTGTTQRMAERNRAAIVVDLGFSLIEQIQTLEHGQALSREGFVQLHGLDVVDAQTLAKIIS